MGGKPVGGGLGTERGRRSARGRPKVTMGRRARLAARAFAVVRAVAVQQGGAVAPRAMQARTSAHQQLDAKRVVSESPKAKLGI